MPGISENVSDPVFARDGQTIRVFAVLHRYEYLADGQHDGRDPASSSCQPNPNRAHNIRPMAKRVAFRSNQSGHNEIWVADVDSPSTARQLTHIGEHLNRIVPGGHPTVGVSLPIRDRTDRPTSTSSMRAPATRSKSPQAPPKTWFRAGRTMATGSISPRTAAEPGRFGRSRRRRHGGPGDAPGWFRSVESPDGAMCTTRRDERYQACGACLSREGPEEQVLSRLKPGYWGYWAAMQWQPLLRR